MSAASPAYASYSDFYRAEYGSYIRDITTAGPFTLLDLCQTAGDFSDHATSDVCIIRGLSRSHVHANFGAGAFSCWTRRGDLAINPAGVANSIVIDQQHRIDVLAVPLAALRALDPDEVLPADGDFGRAHASQHQDSMISRLMDVLWASGRASSIDLEADAALVWLGRRLVELGRPDVNVEPAAAEKLSPYFLKLARDRIEAVGEPPASLNELAKLCRLSPHHFCRAFKAATGLAPHQYQTFRRIERAKALLRDTNLSIAEVSIAIGYEDPSYFSRIFSRVAGYPPRIWRQIAAK